MTTQSFNEKYFNSLNERINTLVSDRLISIRSEALIYLFLSHRFYKEQFEIEEAITDGPNDCGIDAVYIDRSGDHPTIHLFQSKLHESTRKASNPFKVSAADKCFKFFEVVKDRDCDLSKVVNSALAQKIREIRDLQDRDFPAFKLWLISNGIPCTPHDIKLYERGLSQYDISLEEFHLDQFVEFCLNAHSRKHNTFFMRVKPAYWNSETLNYVASSATSLQGNYMI